ncbi:class I SAM-dependent methyltransferase [Mucilaginibacter xinganensis]|uniref:class I SAM-dependent methyltransferase n=1 Tax=Mucilaginibacter xinganensis TaxID=1234841 RepID=UPI0012FDD2D3|nr:class I SAM-dependent methyltransferase [Mucilaginibacter xinganensis]
MKERPVVEAYDIWADSYDHQPGNLMLDLDQLLLSQLLVSADVNGKDVADIGCGTGRHWPFILNQDPASLTGFDVSPGMLHKLKEKFPAAKAHTITNNRFSEIPGDSYDVILSTLTIAHIENIEEALQSWSRLLKPTGDIVITDFHPNVLASGGQRTFKHHNGHIAVRNFVHPVDALKKILLKCNFVVAAEVEKRVDESVKHYYQQQNALHVYDKFKGFPIIYGIHFRRG